jgi:hypothetical protein
MQVLLLSFSLASCLQHRHVLCVRSYIVRTAIDVKLTSGAVSTTQRATLASLANHASLFSAATSLAARVFTLESTFSSSVSAAAIPTTDATTNATMATAPPTAGYTTTFSGRSCRPAERAILGWETQLGALRSRRPCATIRSHQRDRPPSELASMPKKLLVLKVSSAVACERRQPLIPAPVLFRSRWSCAGCCRGGGLLRVWRRWQQHGPPLSWGARRWAHVHSGVLCGRTSMSGGSTRLDLLLATTLA